MGRDMSNARRLREKPVLPKALACAMLEDEGRVLFLVTNDEKIELPSVLVYEGMNPISELAIAFKKQTGIDGSIGGIEFEARYNAGSRKKKCWVPCLVFRVMARERRAKTCQGFSGFKWLSLEDARVFVPTRISSDKHYPLCDDKTSIMIYQKRSVILLINDFSR